jgi:hypothetical protein
MKSVPSCLYLCAGQWHVRRRPIAEDDESANVECVREPKACRQNSAIAALPAYLWILADECACNIQRARHGELSRTRWRTSAGPSPRLD